MIIAMRFDPVTQSEAEYLKQYRRHHPGGRLQVTVLEEGIADKGVRLYLLKRALKPYRHIEVCEEKPDLVVRDFEDEENSVRSGQFFLAAKGIRGILAESSLYLEQITDACCKKERAVHSAGVAETAASLALRHGVPPQTAYKAGMLHDITKRWSDEEGRKYLESRNPAVLKLNPKIWHSYTAAYWIRENMGITDRTFLHALMHHTVGDGKTKLDHILYIADKTEPGRQYDCEKELRLAYQDLYAAAELVRNEAVQYILDKEGIDVGNT